MAHGLWHCPWPTAHSMAHHARVMAWPEARLEEGFATVCGACPPQSAHMPVHMFTNRSVLASDRRIEFNIEDRDTFGTPDPFHKKSGSVPTANAQGPALISTMPGCAAYRDHSDCFPSDQSLHLAFASSEFRGTRSTLDARVVRLRDVSNILTPEGVIGLHIDMRTDLQTGAHARTHVRTHARVRACARTHARTRTRTSTHPPTHTHTPTHPTTCPLTHSPTHSPTHPPKRAARVHAPCDGYVVQWGRKARVETVPKGPKAVSITML